MSNIKYGLIGLVSLILVLLAWASTPTFEIVGGGIVFTAVILAVSQKFQDKMKFAKRALIFIVLCLLVNLFYVVTKWATEKVYNDNSMWSPSIFALLVIGAVAWFVHWFGGPRKGTIAILSAFIGLMVYVLIAIGLGGDEGVRFAFIFVMAFEVVVTRLAIPSFLRVRDFKGGIHTHFGSYLMMGWHGGMSMALLCEAVALPIVMVTQWPLTNWQIVVTCLSVPVSWYILYEVWGKYL